MPLRTRLIPLSLLHAVLMYDLARAAKVDMTPVVAAPRVNETWIKGGFHIEPNPAKPTRYNPSPCMAPHSKRKRQWR